MPAMADIYFVKKNSLSRCNRVKTTRKQHFLCDATIWDSFLNFWDSMNFKLGGFQHGLLLHVILMLHWLHILKLSSAN